MQDHQTNIALVCNNAKRLQKFSKWLKDPNTRISTFEFNEAVPLAGLLREHLDFVILDCSSQPDFDYRQLETLRHQQSLRYVPFLFILSEEQDTLKKQVYLIPNNYLLIEPVDTFAFVSLVTSALHTANLERRLLMYKDFVEGEKKLISNMDSLLELNRLYEFEQENSLLDFIRTGLMKRLELALALETVVFADYSELERTLTVDLYDDKNQRVLKRHSFRIEGSAVAKLLRLSHPHIIEGSALNDPFVQEMEESLGVKINSLLFIPLNVFHRPIGALLLLNKLYRNEFSENDLAFGLLVSQKLSYRLENLRMKAIQTSEQNDLEVLFGKDNRILKEWKLYKQILDSVNFGAILFDTKGRVYYRNNAAARLLRIPDRKKAVQNLQDVFSKEELDRILENIGNTPLPITRQELHMEHRNIPDYYLGYSIYPLDEPDEPSKFIIVFSEISRSKRIQAEIIRMDRMASLGILSSGIAHEIRNPLAGIKAMAQTLEEEIAGNPTHKEYVDRILRQVNRLDNLLKAFFSYAKPKRPDPSAIHVKKIVMEVLPLFERKMRDENITVRQSYARDLYKVFVDANQIEQVFINLLINAFDAIKDEGTVTIHAENAKHPQPFFDRRNRIPSLFSDRYIQITISDTGSGMPDEVREKIFNPFFTTKSNGTGLGLSIVYQIIKEHGGQIEAKSWPGKGSEFTILLPAAVEENEAEMIR